jgi:hypothetical protein
MPAQGARTSNEYGELNRYGLVIAKTQLNLIPFEHSQVLPFRDLFHLLFKLLTCAECFYQIVGYRGTLLVQASLSSVAQQMMPFIPSDPYRSRPATDFNCCAHVVSAERITDVEDIGAQKLNLFVDILSELAWAFWQSPDDFPLSQLDVYARETVTRMGRI